MRSTLPCGVSTASKATEPTTRTDIRLSFCAEVLTDDGVEPAPGGRGDELSVGDESMGQGAGALAVARRGKRAHGVADHVLRVLRVAAEALHDLRAGYGIVPGMPAIVVGDHGHGGVADLCFTGEASLGEVRHADDVEAELAVDVRLGERRELGPLDADIGSPAVDDHAGRCASVAETRGELSASGLVEGDVRHETRSEESVHAMAGAIEELVDHQEMAGGEILAQRANRADGNNALDA